MTKSIPIVFRLCLLPVLFALVTPFASADVIHVTSGISIAPGDTGTLNWNVDGSEDGNTSVEFVIEYIPLGFGSRGLNVRAELTDPLRPEAVITRGSKVVGLPVGFLVGAPLPDDLSWSQEIETLTASDEPLVGFADFTENTPGFIGFSFQRSGMTLYGWAKLTVIPGDLVDEQPTISGLTISEWAYDTTGAPLSVPVPEPSITAILTLGTWGLALRKCRAGQWLALCCRKSAGVSPGVSQDSQPQHFPVKPTPVLDFPAV
ncbi:MAG: PEP-CTERM sorting domain-containing protein [Planctomycetota bacterium]